ncbi:hypothetical protein, partial [Klebsiella quasipneumoniae]|uniref:hypothetical protein n=1 Tax=Klebsiella quasipneumoniae TaxID=1463165 RepID=UPI00222E7D69
MTLIAAPGTTARTRWSALIAAALVFAVLLVPAPASAAMLSTATATPTPTPTAALSGEVTLVLAPAANGLLTAGQASAATVELDNGTASTAAGGTATLTIGAAALTERTALAAWLSGDAATPPGAS